MRYVVEKGDSLSAIAAKHNSSVAAIKSLNELTSDVIQIGQELRLQGHSTILISEHTIRSGETLSQIAVRYSISLAKLRAANNLTDDKILVGQILKIPTIWISWLQPSEITRFKRGTHFDCATIE